MAEKPEEFNLPNSIIMRLLKDAAPDGVSISKEARTAFARAGSIFILYLTACSNNYALRAKRKTLTVVDVFAALEEMEFGSFVESLTKSLDVFQTERNKKSQPVVVSDKKKSPDTDSATQESPIDDLSTEVSDSIADGCE